MNQRVPLMRCKLACTKSREAVENLESGDSARRDFLQLVQVLASVRDAGG